jgi:hypothetical protein
MELASNRTFEGLALISLSVGQFAMNSARVAGPRMVAPCRFLYSQHAEFETLLLSSSRVKFSIPYPIIL